jgi:AraC family transcriptional regulator
MVRLNQGQFFGNPVHVAHLAGLHISQARYSPHAQLPRHSHPQPYLCLVAAGAFEERAGRRLETCRAGSVVWNPSGGEHEDHFGNIGARTVNLELGDRWSERMAEAARVWTPAKGVEVSWLTARILRELAHTDTASALAMEGLVCALIGEVSRDPTPVDHRRPAWLTRARDRLMVEFRHSPSVAELAQEAGVHRSHFARSFRSHFGCTVSEFVRRLRIEWAGEQLRSRQFTLSEVSLRAGFGDQAHFTRAFKRITGVTPGEYRATAR